MKNTICTPILRIATLLVSVALLAPFAATAQTQPAPKPLNIDYTELAEIREQIQAGDPAVLPAYNALIEQADKLLDAPAHSVLEKTQIPPSGDKHDYFDIGNYAWPNPNTPDGMPYIRRDGYRNPEAQGPQFDKQRYNTTLNRINTLSLAWFYSGDEKYAQKATQLLRTWFLDSETRMNPHFNYAASLPGVYDGHYIGIIVGVAMIQMLDYAQLLQTSTAWTDADEAALKQWFADFTTWLKESEFGKQEIKLKNNHGTWYLAQVVAYSIYTGNEEDARSYIELAKGHLDHQIAEDGSLPEELRRNRSYMYSVYAMRALVTLARAGDVIGIDLWEHQTPKGSSIKTAFEFLAPYFSGQKEWQWQSLDKHVDHFAIQISRLGYKAYDLPELHEALLNLSGQKGTVVGPKPTNRMIWLLGINPILEQSAPATE